MLVKKLLICSSPPNGDNKTLPSAFYIFFPPPAWFPLSEEMQMIFGLLFYFILKFISNRRTDGEGWVGAGGRGRAGTKHLWFVCFLLPYAETF